MGQLIKFPNRTFAPNETLTGLVPGGEMGSFLDDMFSKAGSKVQSVIDQGKSAVVSSTITQTKQILADPEVQQLTANFVDMQIERKKALIGAFFVFTGGYVAFSIFNLIRSR